MAKFCVTCGANLGDTTSFCPGCGTQTVAAPKKKSKALPVLLGGAALLVVLIVIIAVAGRDSGNGPAPYPPGYNSGGIPMTQTGGDSWQAAQAPITQAQQPGGNLDPKLIGEWNYEDISLHGSEHHNYFFCENGTATLLITGGMNYHGEVKFSVSGGKIHFTEYYTIDAIGNKELRIDKTVEYSIETDDRGEYLTIGNIPGLTAYGENRPNMKFRRV